MPCGKRPLIKNWDKPRKIRVVTKSRYEQNEASVKQHWKNVIKSLELSYKDDQFWESQGDTVREQVGPNVFNRIAKIFDIPLQRTPYEIKSEATVLPSENYYTTGTTRETLPRPVLSMSDYEPSLIEEERQEEIGEEQSEQWSLSSVAHTIEEKKTSRMKSLSVVKSKSLTLSKLFSKSKSFSKYFSKTLIKSVSSKSKPYTGSLIVTSNDSTNSEDDLEVHLSMLHKSTPYAKRTKNPHFEMLYCNESESDMIKWNSKYKQKVFEVSASDEFSKKAEIMTKKIALEFYEWWVNLGNVEFKSEIKRPEDIEDLFQVWFDEHASRGLVLYPKILPCVLKTIADYICVPREACPKVLKRQIAHDIHAETSPAHTVAFGTCLSQKLKHLPPMNNTKMLWHGVQIPEDLRSMACVWDDIQHLTSTKAFHQWLEKRPHLPMPPCLKSLGTSGDKKQLFVVPSDYVFQQDRSGTASTQELALPVSQFSLELKEVLSKLMNQ